MNPSKNIDKQISDLSDWRGKKLSEIRRIVLATDLEIKEEWKWDTAVWVNNGLVCAGGVFKDHVKLNFFKGASLPDPNKLFNSGLEAKNSRSIDFKENDEINESVLKDLIAAAVEFNSKAKNK